MPTVFTYRAYRFFFYSNEGNPREPLHIHVRKGDAIVKFWLEPMFVIGDSFGFASHELKELLEIALRNKNLIRKAWDEHFNQ